MKSWKMVFAAALLIGAGAFATLSEAAAGDAVEISISTVLPPGTPIPTGLDHFSKALNETGQFKVAVYPSGQLGSINDMLDRCLDGDPIIATCDSADLAEVTVKDLSVIQAPFLFESWDQVAKVMNSRWWADLGARVKQRGMVILGNNWIGGERHIVTKKPIVKVADLAGLKIRTPNSVNFVKSFEALGAAPTPMTLTEVFTSLQQGVIDGLENPYADIYANKFQEVAKFIVEDDHIKQMTLIVCGAKFFDSLTPGQRDMLMSLCRKSGEYEQGVYFKIDGQMKKKLADEGVTFTRIDRPEFIKAAEKYYAYPEFKAWTPGLRETVLKIIAE